MRSFHRTTLALAAVTVLAIAAFAGTQLGQPLTLNQQTPIANILASPESYVGQRVQVRGKVSAVCEKMGCWMTLVDSETGKFIKIKVNDGEIVFPKEAIGKLAVAEGKLQKLELTKEQAIAHARHAAEEKDQAFDPASVKGPVTMYQIQGTGAVVMD